MTELIQRVGYPMFIQMVIEFWNELILIMLTTIMLVGKSLDRHNELIKKTKIPLTNELIVFYFTAFFYNLFDISNRILEKTSSEPFLFVTVVFMYYAVGEFLTLLFLQVIKKYVAEKNGNQKLKRAVSAVQLFNMVNYIMLAVNPFTNVLYTISGNNIYERSWGYYLWQGISIASFVFIFVILLAERKRVDVFIKRIFIVSEVFPAGSLSARGALPPDGQKSRFP